MHQIKSRSIADAVKFDLSSIRAASSCGSRLAILA